MFSSRAYHSFEGVVSALRGAHKRKTRIIHAPFQAVLLEKAHG
jgi:hypothetical protein